MRYVATREGSYKTIWKIVIVDESESEPQRVRAMPQVTYDRRCNRRLARELNRQLLDRLSDDRRVI